MIWTFESIYMCMHMCLCIYVYIYIYMYAPYVFRHNRREKRQHNFFPLYQGTTILSISLNKPKIGTPVFQDESMKRSFRLLWNNVSENLLRRKLKKTNGMLYPSCFSKRAADKNCLSSRYCNTIAQLV